MVVVTPSTIYNVPVAPNEVYYYRIHKMASLNEEAMS